eukprot:6473733-Prorocentrum_lima.AAC.1
MSRPPSARHSPIRQTHERREVEDGRVESARSRSKSPTLRNASDHPMDHVQPYPRHTAASGRVETQAGS